MEAAIELGFLNNRIGIEASYYRNRSGNQLVQYQLPYTTGFTSIISNFNATVENTGIELLINTQTVKGNNFGWNTSFNITLPRNQLIEFTNIQDSPYASLYQVGKSLSVQRLYNWLGVNPATGVHTIQDLDGNGIVNPNIDKQFMIDLDRKYYGGILNTLSYSAFEVSTLFQFSRQNSPIYMSPGEPGSIGNQPVKVLQRWKSVDDATEVQRFSQSNASFTNYQNTSESNYRYVDGSFIRLKTLSASYLFPKILLARAKLKEARIYVQGQNLLTFSDYPTLDPETGSGIPPLKILTFGIQIKL